MMSTTAHTELHVQDVSVQFGGLRAVHGVTLSLRPGEIVGLIGPNGAGKTTLVNVLSGFQRPTAGSVLIDGTNVTGRAVPRFADAGVARTFQEIKPFDRLTVEENIRAAATSAGARRSSTGSTRSRVDELLALTDLERHRSRDARELSHGDRRRLGLARALAIAPTYLLLDEPAAGLNEAEGASLVALLRELRDQFRVGILLIEHDMSVVMTVCERLHVLDHGQTIAHGAPAEIQKDPLVLEAYLGSSSTNERNSDA